MAIETMDQRLKLLVGILSTFFLFFASCDSQITTEAFRGADDELTLVVHGKETKSYRLQPAYLAIEQWGLVELFLGIGFANLGEKEPELAAARIQLYHLPDSLNGKLVVPSNYEAADGLPSFYFELSKILSGAWEGQYGLIGLRGEIVIEQFRLLENHLDIKAIVSITEAIEQQCAGCPSQTATVTGTLSYHGPFPLRVE